MEIEIQRLNKEEIRGRTGQACGRSTKRPFCCASVWAPTYILTPHSTRSGEAAWPTTLSHLHTTQGRIFEHLRRSIIDISMSYGGLTRKHARIICIEAIEEGPTRQMLLPRGSTHWKISFCHATVARDMHSRPHKFNS